MAIIDVYLFIVFTIIGFTIDKLPFVKIVKSLISLSHYSLQLMQTKSISERRKEKFLLYYSFRILKKSMQLLFFISFIIIIIGISLQITHVIKSFSHYNLLNYISSIRGLIITSLSFLFYYLLKMGYAKFRL